MERIARTLPPGHPDDAHAARRQSRRWPLHATVLVEAPTPGEGVTLNASAGGLRIAVDCPLSIGDSVTLTVETDRHSYRETAQVIWARVWPDGVLAGLRFVA